MCLLLQAIPGANGTPPVLLIEEIDLSSRNDFFCALRANLVTNDIEWKLFNDLFDRFWKKNILSSPTKDDELLSDALETDMDLGGRVLLKKEMETIWRKAYRTDWLNSMAGEPGYRPVYLGMRAVLEYIDHFLPVNNLQNLKRVGRTLSGIMTEN